MQERDHGGEQNGRDYNALDDSFVVTLADVVPEPLVDTERGQHDQRAEHHPDDRVAQQHAVARVQPTRIPLEAEPEGEEVSERDQNTVDEQLGQ